ncbi:alpha/beta fold hydrolase [Pseudorhodobacter sp.]|uniref:alpha/beta fold hydrolase n=1 Tax=Pseudorhodobacter sp. TaxID=1934400 RepID=UPI002647104E|nr:alpha/beta fold hydrolase [Pseudorhodobacter sp.]MDN5786273.1 alpha/beta fold hydrolase [Pseudorhodobacter sp.]
MLNMISESPQTPSGLPPLLIVHGLFGSARNWGVIARRMAADRQVVAVDMRNHGSSPRAESQSYADMAGDLAEVIAAHGGRMDVVGHSMGGKAAMQLALTHGVLVDRLVVADIAPVAYAHDQSHHIAAMRSLDLSGIAARSEADRRLAQQMDDPALRAFFLQSLDLKATPPRWRLNLDVLEAEMPKIVGWPGTKGQFAGPTLFLAGAESHYVKPEYRETIRTLFPAARFAKLPGAGHWLHAEKPKEFEAALRVFLTR